MGIRFVREAELPRDGISHDFVGEKFLRQIDVHLSPRFITEWLA